MMYLKSETHWRGIKSRQKEESVYLESNNSSKLKHHTGAGQGVGQGGGGGVDYRTKQPQGLALSRCKRKGVREESENGRDKLT